MADYRMTVIDCRSKQGRMQMTEYKLTMIEYMKYAVTLGDQRIGTILMDGEIGNPMFHYLSDDGTVKGSVPEIKDAVRALKAWNELKEV